MFRRQTTRQIRQQVRAQEEARNEARRRSRAANRRGRRSAKRAADQPNWVCIACQEVSNDDMGQVMECCNCKALGRFHWDCLAGQILATADANCVRCLRKYKDWSGKHRIKRYQNYGPNILDYAFNYMLRTNPGFPRERQSIVILILTYLTVCIGVWLFIRLFGDLTGLRGHPFFFWAYMAVACFENLFWDELVVNYARFRTKFPRDMVRLTQLADGEEKIMDLTTKREQDHLENVANMQLQLQQLQQKMQQGDDDEEEEVNDEDGEEWGEFDVDEAW